MSGVISVCPVVDAFSYTYAASVRQNTYRLLRNLILHHLLNVINSKSIMVYGVLISVLHCSNVFVLVFLYYVMTLC